MPEDATLAAGVNEAENLDPRAAGRAWKLFEIKPMLAALLPLVSPLKWVVYLLPFLGLSALILGHPLRESCLRGPGDAARGDDAARPCDHQPAW